MSVAGAEERRSNTLCKQDLLAAWLSVKKDLAF